MSFVENFNATEEVYQEVCKKATEPGNFFFTQRYADLRKTALEVSRKVDKLLLLYIDIIMNDAEAPDFKNVKSYMCYPERYLKVKENSELPKDKYKQIKLLLDRTVRLGLMVHLFLVYTPTREEGYAKVNMDNIRKEWSSRILRVERVMRQYNIDVKKLPGKIFDNYYKDYVEPVLRDDLKINGILKMKQQYDFFHKLYSSGILLGLETDFATRSV